MKKNLLVLLLTAATCAAIALQFSRSPSETNKSSEKERIRKEIANDVFIPTKSENKGALFLNQITTKPNYFSSYEVRMTNIVHSTSGDWRFFTENFEHIGEVKLIIAISESAYRFLLKLKVNDQSTLEAVPPLKGLYQCVNSCFKRLEQTSGELETQCDCKAAFSESLIN